MHIKPMWSLQCLKTRRKLSVNCKGPARIEKQETACRSALLHHTFSSLSLTRPLRVSLTFRSPCVLKVCSHKGNMKHACTRVSEGNRSKCCSVCFLYTGEQHRVLALVSDVNVLLRRDPAWHTWELVPNYEHITLQSSVTVSPEDRKMQGESASQVKYERALAFSNSPQQQRLQQPTHLQTEEWVLIPPIQNLCVLLTKILWGKV